MITHFPVSTNLKWNPVYLISPYPSFPSWAWSHTFFIQVPLFPWPSCYIFSYYLQISSEPPMITLVHTVNGFLMQVPGLY